MAQITRIELWMVDLKPKVVRTDAIQSFVSQETPIVRITDADGTQGIGYSYTIGTGGSSVIALLADHLAPALIGREAAEIEAIWHDLFFKTHATAVGTITSLALAALDTALWDLRCTRAGEPLWRLAGGARRAAEDVARLAAVRDAVGPEFEIMTDANQAFTVDEAIRRARLYEPIDIAWFEEPLPAEDLGGHVRLSRATTIPVAIGESLYHPSHFREYLQREACSIVQVDVARVGGITPWLKTAHLAETFNVPVCPHFLMELHVSLCAAVPNARWVEYIPQLDPLTAGQLTIENGHALAPEDPGIGIDWDMDAVTAQAVFARELT